MVSNYKRGLVNQGFPILAVDWQPAAAPEENERGEQPPPARRARSLRDGVGPTNRRMGKPCLMNRITLTIHFSSAMIRQGYSLWPYMCTVKYKGEGETQQIGRAHV